MIAIGGLFYNAAEFLDTYFKMLLIQDYPKRKIRLIWLYGEGDDETLRLLKQFGEKHGRDYAEFTLFQINRIPGDMTGTEGGKIAQENIVKAYTHLVELSRPDDLIIMEQDIDAPPHAIRRLIELRDDGAGIAGGLCLVTGAELKVKAKNGGIFRVGGLPSVSSYVLDQKRELQPISRQAEKFNCTRMPKELLSREMYVDAIATGLSLLTRKVLDDIPFETSHKRTQDLHFCIRAREKGYRIICDTGLWYEHLHYKYRREILSDGSLFITLLDSLKLDGITFEATMPNQLESSAHYLIELERGGEK